MFIDQSVDPIDKPAASQHRGHTTTRNEFPRYDTKPSGAIINVWFSFVGITFRSTTTQSESAC